MRDKSGCVCRVDDGGDGAGVAGLPTGLACPRCARIVACGDGADCRAVVRICGGGCVR